MIAVHKPVMVKEVLKVLDVRPGRNYIDATVGEGGHAKAILEKSITGKLLGIDRDPVILKRARKLLAPYQQRVILKAGPASQLLQEVKQNKTGRWFGILFDLGVSSWHLRKSGRGFSFQNLAEPLDMRFNPEENKLTAAWILNNLPKQELKAIFEKFGQEPYAGTIASRVIQMRTKVPFRTTGDFLQAVRQGVPTAILRARRHPATRVFQALRIAVNQELAEVEKALLAAAQLKPRRIAVITFHSLENKLVVRIFKDLESKGQGSRFCSRPIKPREEEIKQNPQARSARLYGFSFC